MNEIIQRLIDKMGIPEDNQGEAASTRIHCSRTLKFSSLLLIRFNPSA